MFRRFLNSNREFCQIELVWMKKMNGLIRVVIFDPDCSTAYVVVYYEQINKYTLNAFCSLSGELYWSTDVPNGGYGAPAIIDDCIVILTEFTNVTAICKNSGQIKWTFNTQTRIRSPINVVNNKVYFSSGGILYELNSKGEELKQWNYPKAFFYGSVDIINELIIRMLFFPNFKYPFPNKDIYMIVNNDDTTDITTILSSFHPKRFSKGDFLIKDGQTCNHIFFIKSGLAKTFSINGDREFIMQFFFEIVI